MAIRTVLVVVHAVLKARKKPDAGPRARAGHVAQRATASPMVLLVKGVLAKVVLAKAGQVKAALTIKAARKAKAVLGVQVQDGQTRTAVRVAGLIPGHVLARVDLLAAGESLVVVSHLLAASLRVLVVGLRVPVGPKVVLGAQHVPQLRANLT